MRAIKKSLSIRVSAACAMSLFLCIGVSVGVEPPSKIAEDKSPIESSISGLKLKLDESKGLTIWDIGGKIIRESEAINEQKDNPIFSPNGKAVHFGSFKHNAQRRTITALYLDAAGSVKNSNGDELPDSVIEVFYGQKKTASSIEIYGCWVDPVKWIDDSNLLITAYMEAPGEEGYSVDNFQCVWNVESGACTYRKEFKSDKEGIIPTKANPLAVKDENEKITQIPRKPPQDLLQKLLNDPDLNRMTYFQADEKNPSKLAMGGLMVTYFDVKLMRKRAFTNAELTLLDVSLSKFNEWLAIAKENKTASFTKQLPGLDNVDFYTQFDWNDESKSARLIIAEKPNGQYSMLESLQYTEPQVQKLKEIFAYVPAARQIIKLKEEENQKKKADIDSKFK